MLKWLFNFVTPTKTEKVDWFRYVWQNKITGETQCMINDFEFPRMYNKFSMELKNHRIIGKWVPYVLPYPDSMPLDSVDIQQLQFFDVEYVGDNSKPNREIMFLTQHNVTNEHKTLKLKDLDYILDNPYLTDDDKNFTIMARIYNNDDKHLIPLTDSDKRYLQHRKFKTI